jgi:hypothetical protein
VLGTELRGLHMLGRSSPTLQSMFSVLFFESGEPRLAWNSRSSCLHLLSAGITEIYNHTQLKHIAFKKTIVYVQA